MKKRLFLLLAGLLLLSACGNAEGTTSSSASENPAPPPVAVVPDEPDPEPELEADHSWQFDAPEKHSMNPETFSQLHSALEDAPVYAMVTVKDGVIIDEYYQDGYDETSTFPFHSASKSFTSALIGVAIDEGYIGGVDDLLSDYLPQVSQLTDGKQNLTLRHLLTQTSGIEWYEWGGGSSNWNEFRSAENWVDYILSRRQLYEPGVVFNYSTGNTHLLSAALEAATGRNQLDYAYEKLFDPLEIETATWGTDPQGVTDGGNGIVMTARDAARFGQLFLQGGIWNGEQLIPADWLTESTTSQNNGAGDGTGSYGYQWWIRDFGGYNTYYAFGAWGQYIFVVPELDLVTVIASPGPQNSYASRAYFTDYVLDAYTGE